MRTLHTFADFEIGQTEPMNWDKKKSPEENRLRKWQIKHLIEYSILESRSDNALCTPLTLTQSLNHRDHH